MKLIIECEATFKNNSDIELKVTQKKGELAESKAGKAAPDTNGHRHLKDRTVTTMQWI